MSRLGWVGWLVVLAGCDRVLGLDPVPPLPDAPVQAPGNWAQVAEGGAHSCGIRLDGSLWCWGDNSSGQLGLGTKTEAAPNPTRIGTTTWTQVAAGLLDTCAIDGAAALWCWGSNSSGQLGDGTEIDQPDPELVHGGPWSAVAVGDRHVCAIDTAGTAWCWGDDSYGELGQNDQSPRATPTKIASANRWTAVTAGTDETCALAADQTAWCWGFGAYGEIGNGTYGQFMVPTQVDHEAWSSISAGGTHVCGSRSDGRLRCWGSNFSGELGVEQITTSISPVAVGDDSLRFTTVSAGAQHTCAATTDNHLWCWGSNQNGQLAAAGDSPFNPDPRQIAGGAVSWASAAAGKTTSCGLGTDHNLWCFGHGSDGGGAVATPTQVAGSWSQVGMGGSTTCAIATDGSLWCWGSNAYGALGDGSYTSRTEPTKIADPAWLSISVGDYAACALRSDHFAFCWGNGPIGDGSTIRLIPTQVNGGPYSSISVGGFHACAIDAGTQLLWCWGMNSSGQLGTGDNNAYLVPTQIGTMTWTQVIGAFDHSCGSSGGNALCWGNGSTGQLGDGATSSTTLPTPVGTASSLAAGQFDSCGLQNGALACWGWNEYGEVGDTSFMERVFPVPVPGTWTEVAMQLVHVCALASDGTLWCWGNNVDGQLAQPTTEPELGAPIQVGSSSSWKQVSVGGDASCGIQSDSSLWCWGDNSAGQLGIGTTIVPGPVLVP
ncbi:MAG TPA: hypothetical protein VGF94_00455 [Kofleriaceae bacterium]|jgi:alpha-tubulin suppressor-like RCC1 family protein